jgi:hypothetical protein
LGSVVVAVWKTRLIGQYQTYWPWSKQARRAIIILSNTLMADEAGFLELLIANERIGRALDMLCDPYQRKKYDGNLKSIFLSSQGPTK